MFRTLIMQKIVPQRTIRGSLRDRLAKWLQPKPNNL